MSKEHSALPPFPDILKKVRNILQEFGNAMPPEWPNRLPLRRKVSHAIKLELGSKLPAIGPYQMALPQHEELKSN